MPVIPATWEAEIEGLRFKADISKCLRPYLKNKTKSKRAGGRVQVVDSMPSRCKALISISILPHPPKKERKKKSAAE
jgi:hypothetical protein